MKPIRVLVVGMTDTVGGIENFLMSYLEHMDPSRIRFDFLTRFAGAVYPERRAAIGQTFVVPKRSESPVRYYREIRAFFARHAREYDVIWDNECMFNDMTPLKLAAKYGIPVRIAHSHNPQNMDVSLKGRLQELLHRIHRRRMGRYANVLWACSEDSARWVCPRMDIPWEVIPNAIRVRLFRPREKVRAEVRAEYGLTGCLVVGHVGRLQYQKNQAFLLEAFAHLRQQEPRARLVLAGDGPDLAELEARAVQLGISADVLFLGVRGDVPRLMQAFDLFAMPSRFEGLGMAALEAQAADLPCLLSEGVPRAAAVTEHVTFLPARDAQQWGQRMHELLLAHRGRARCDNTQRIAEAGYDIQREAEKLTARMEQLLDRSASFRRRFLLTVCSGAKGVPAMNKARQDIEHFARQAGYIPVPLKAPDTAQGGGLARVRLLMQVLGDWMRLCIRLRRGDLLLMQYPYFPVKGARVAKMALRVLKLRGVKTAALIHDLDSLRSVGGQAARWSDQALLPAFDHLVTHNARMSAYLLRQGMPAGRMTELTLFDYRTDVNAPVRTLSPSVCVAGNLRADKSGYLTALPASDLTWHLYGSGWAGSDRPNVVYHGVCPADELPGRLEGSFGLVWDGDSASGCSGVYGCYLMLNNPHKMSLYLVAGMPVVVWRRSAQADFVMRNGVGLVIDSLAELPARLAALQPGAYDAMALRARTIGAALREGRYTQQVLKKLDRL